MFDELVAATTGARGAVAVDTWTRVESAACARRLAAMLTMLDDAHAAEGCAEREYEGCAEREQWCIDNWAAVCAHIGAAQRITGGAASGSRLLFPTPCEPTAPVILTGTAPPPAAHTRGLMMPRRRRTRAQDRAARIATERDLNHAWLAEEETKLTAEPPPTPAEQPAPPDADDDPPPF